MLSTYIYDIWHNFSTFLSLVSLKKSTEFRTIAVVVSFKKLLLWDNYIISLYLIKQWILFNRNNLKKNVRLHKTQKGHPIRISGHKNVFHFELPGSLNCLRTFFFKIPTSEIFNRFTTIINVWYVNITLKKYR